LFLAREHKQSEEYLSASACLSAILRNGWYLENHTSALENAVEHGAFDLWLKPGLGITFNVRAAKARLREEDRDFLTKEAPIAVSPLSPVQSRWPCREAAATS
jgi:uncharacterized protein YbjT (DUF2867 family)